jgi:hypothetical protein
MDESRRQVLKSSGYALAAVIAYATSPATGSTAPSSKARLMAFSRQLYPYDDLSDRVYAEVIDTVLADPAQRDDLQACADAIGDFLTMDDAEQIQAIRELEQTTYFEQIRNAIRMELHNRPELWQLIGYRGPSLPFGGYAREKPASLEWLNFL